MRRSDEDLCWELKEDYCETRRLFRENRRLCEHIGFEQPRDLDSEDEFDSSQDSSASDSSASEDFEFSDSASGDSESVSSEDSSDTTLYATVE